MRPKPAIKPNYSRAAGGGRRSGSANREARETSEHRNVVEKKPLRKTEISLERTSSLATVKMRGTRNFLSTTRPTERATLGLTRTSCQREIKAIIPPSPRPLDGYLFLRTHSPAVAEHLHMSCACDVPATAVYLRLSRRRQQQLSPE